MIVTMLDTEQSRESAWRVEHNGRVAVIRHVHDEVVRAKRSGGAWFTVAVADVGTVRVHERDFTAAVNVARAMLSGGAL